MPQIRIILILLVGICFRGFSQNTQVDVLQQNREAQIRKIEETNRILRSQKTVTQTSIDRLKAIQEQISQRNLLMLNLTSELSWLADKMEESDLVINDLTEDLDTLKSEYAAMIYFSSKSGGAVEKLSYLFSSETANQFIARIQYLKQYQESRKTQISSIQKVKTTLTKRREDYISMERDKKMLLDSLSSNDHQLFDLHQKQEILVTQLKKKEQKLRQDLIQQRKILAELNKKIEEQVQKQIVMSESGEVELKETPKIARVAAKFEDAKGYLIWPVEEGFIASRFGKHPHPVLKDIWVENNGVDIRTNENSKVRVVYPGKVVSVTKIPGMDWMVLVQHGNYFTAYSRLKKVAVSTNDEVNKHQTLGIVSSNEQGIAEVQFQIWRNQHKVNPEYWLAK